MNKWLTPRCEVRFERQEADDNSGYYGILTWFIQLYLDVFFALGSSLLSLQLMWRELFPISQQEPSSIRAVACGQEYDLRSFTVIELKQHDGVQQNSIYFAVNGKVFDATNASGIQFLDGAIDCIAGRDASRALATYSLTESQKSESQMDDLSDMNPLQLDCLFHWEMQCLEVYPCVGKLVKSHQPRALQQVCIRTIRASLRKSNSCSKLDEPVDELPLPKILRNNIVNYG